MKDQWRRGCHHALELSQYDDHTVGRADPSCRLHRRDDGVIMSHLFWQNLAQMGRLQSFRPESHRTPRLDDKRMLIGLVFINCNRL